MPAYLVAEIEMTKPDRVRTLSGGGRRNGRTTWRPLLVRGGATELIEGQPEPKTIVILEFPDSAAIKRWYDSPEYQKMLPSRLDNSTGRLFIVEGAS